MTNYITVAQFAANFSISHMTVRRMIDDGQLEHVRLRGSFRIPATEIARLTRGNK